MSYEPTILIRRRDLEKNRSLIENMVLFGGYSKLKQEDRDAWDYVYKALETEDKFVIKFPEIELISISPEGTTFNGKVRKILFDFDIEFKVDY